VSRSPSCHCQFWMLQHCLTVVALLLLLLPLGWLLLGTIVRGCQMAPERTACDAGCLYGQSIT